MMNKKNKIIYSLLLIILLCLMFGSVCLTNPTRIYASQESKSYTWDIDEYGKAEYPELNTSVEVPDEPFCFDDITIDFTDGSIPTKFLKRSGAIELTIYTNGSINFTCPESVSINSIEFYGVLGLVLDSSTSVGQYDSQSQDAGTWSAEDTDVKNVKFSSSNKNTKISKIIINYTVTKPDERVLDSIYISGTPTMLTYGSGGSFNYSGLKVMGRYLDDLGDAEITQGIEWTCSPEVLTRDTTSVDVTASVKGKTSEPKNIVITVSLSITDMLSKTDKFPTTPEIGWDNGNGLRIYVSDGKLNLYMVSQSHSTEYLSITSPLTGTNEIFVDGVTNTFNFEGEKLVSITISGLPSFDGTYIPPKAISSELDNVDAGTIIKDASEVILSNINNGTISIYKDRASNNDRVVEIHYSKISGGDGYAELKFNIGDGYSFVGLAYSFDGINYTNIDSYPEFDEEIESNYMIVGDITECFKLKVLTEKIVTVGDILPIDFPSFTMPLSSSVWINENCSNAKLFKNLSNGLTFSSDEFDTFDNILNSPLIKIEGGYKLVKDSLTITFVMESDELVKITLAGSEHTNNNGDYFAPHFHSAITSNSRVEATCVVAGHQAYYQCSCGSCFSDVECLNIIDDLTSWLSAEGNGYIAPIQHNWSDVSYDMNGDKCTATRTCLNDHNHVETETVSGIYIIDSKATRNSNEKGHYEFIFNNPFFTKKVTELNSVELDNTKLSGLTVGAIVGISIGSFILILIIVYISMFIYWKKKDKGLKFLISSFKWINKSIFKK